MGSITDEGNDDTDTREGKSSTPFFESARVGVLADMRDNCADDGVRRWNRCDGKFGGDGVSGGILLSLPPA